MTTTIVSEPQTPSGGADDKPRSINVSLGLPDQVFRFGVLGIAVLTLVLTAAIGLFLGLKLIPTFERFGTKFFTGTAWTPQYGKVGMAGALFGTFEVAIVAVLIGFPLALLTALWITEYAPPRFRGFFVSMVDLMAAVPSIIFGIWGLFALAPQAKFVSRWISQNLGWIPIFKVDGDPNAASWAQADYTGSAFIVGIVVGLMIIPLACSVMRGVFALTPLGEKEAAYALGSTKWGMIRTVVLPFGRGGIIGGTMLGLGRALGETVAVLLIYHDVDGIKVRPLGKGINTISALIANTFGDARGPQLNWLIAAGFVLFVITIGINTIAAIFVSRSRSGEGT